MTNYVEVPGTENSDGDFSATSQQLFHCDVNDLEVLFPVWVISAKNLVDLKPPLEPHADMKALGLIKQYDPDSKRKLLFVSHQWLGYKHPDPKFEQFPVLQEAIKCLAAGTLYSAKDPTADAINAEVMLLTQEEQKGAMEWDIWYDYFACPQIQDRGDDNQASDLIAAVTSIPAYIDLSDFFVTLTPPVKHADGGHPCNKSTWSTRGWCLTERVACVLSPTHKPLLQLANTTNLSVSTGMSWLHEFPADGNFTVESDRLITCDLTLKLLARKSLNYLKEGDLARFRIFISLTARALAGCPDPDKKPKLPDTLEEFYSNYRFHKEQDTFEKGLTPLMLAAISSNVLVVKELVKAKADLEATILEPIPELDVNVGHTVLALATALASAVTVSTLIELRADLNASDTGFGNDPLHYASGFGNLDAINVLLSAGADFRSLSNFGCTCLDISCLQNNMKLVERFLQLRADPNLGNFMGGGLAHTNCLYNTNPDIIDLLVKHGCDVNIVYPVTEQGKPMNAFFKQQVSEGSPSLLHAAFACSPAPIIFTAITCDRPEHLRKLLENKANPMLTNADGLDAIEYANQRPNRDRMLAILQPCIVEDP